MGFGDNTVPFHQFNCHLGPVARKSREFFGTEKPVARLQPACFEKLIFEQVFNARKAKWIAKFDGLESQRFGDIKEIMAPEIGPKSFGTFGKQTPGQSQPPFQETSRPILVGKNHSRNFEKRRKKEGVLLRRTQ